jgi:hypothetical protein
MRDESKVMRKDLFFTHSLSLITHYCPLNDSINYVIVPNCVNFFIFGNFL